MRFEQRRVLEREIGELRGFIGRLRLAKLIEQVGADAARVEKLFELYFRELADLLLRIVDAALLSNAAADLLHDLLDVHGVGSNVEIGHKTAISFQPSAYGRTLSWLRAGGQEEP